MERISIWGLFLGRRYRRLSLLHRNRVEISCTSRNPRISWSPEATRCLGAKGSNDQHSEGPGQHHTKLKRMAGRWTVWFVSRNFICCFFICCSCRSRATTTFKSSGFITLGSESGRVRATNIKLENSSCMRSKTNLISTRFISTASSRGSNSTNSRAIARSGLLTSSSVGSRSATATVSIFHRVRVIRSNFIQGGKRVRGDFIQVNWYWGIWGISCLWCARYSRCFWFFRCFRTATSANQISFGNIRIIKLGDNRSNFISGWKRARAYFIHEEKRAKGYSASISKWSRLSEGHLLY